MKDLTQRDRSWGVSLLILSVVTAVAVSVIYLPQPMLTKLVESLGTSTSGASAIATTVQFGYAIGIFFLVPLGDRVQPRRQITLQLIVLAAALAATAALPTVASVAVGFLVVGLVANIAQLIIPTASRLAPADRSHGTSGVLASAMLIGIFGGRVVAGLLASALGWRGVVLVFAGIVLLTIPFLRYALPAWIEPTSRHRYHALLASTLRRFRTSATLRRSAAMQFATFALLNSFWTVSVLQLTGSNYGWTVAEAGLFGLVGLAAGAVTPFAGGWVKRFGAVRVTGVFAALMIVATVGLIVDSRTIWLFALSMFALTWANQVLHSANQARTLAANADGPAQANTMFMVSVFVGGSLGAALGPIAFQIGGIPAVAVEGLAFAVFFTIAWLRTAGVGRQGSSSSAAEAA